VVTDTANVAHYYGPDARELLSSEFETDHCFTLVAGGGPGSALIGLAFRPVRNRGVPEIEGTLWIDKTTLELRSLEFQYVNAHFPDEVRGVGGRLEFERVQSGAWYPRYWMLRMPRFRESAVNPGLLMLAGYVEMGATATPVGEVDVRALAAGTQAHAAAATARADTIDVVTTAATVLRPGAANGPNTIAADRASCGKFGSAGVPTGASWIERATAPSNSSRLVLPRKKC